LLIAVLAGLSVIMGVSGIVEEASHDVGTGKAIVLTPYRATQELLAKD
jgi:hypothetical protein